MTKVFEFEVTGFHQDDAGDWIADLGCGHACHVRHEPPFNPRAWVLTEEGRQGRLGTLIRCQTCAVDGHKQTDAAETSAPVVAEISVEEGAAAGQVFTVTSFPAVIGRGADADICLDDDPNDPTLSRHHVRLSLSHGRVMLRDISTNGTRVDRRLLGPDDLLSVGSEGTRIWLGPKTRVLISERARVAAVSEPKGPTLETRFLGKFEVLVLGQPILDYQWQSRHAVLLALLADTPHQPVAYQVIYDGLWPPEEEPSRQALQAVVTRIKRTLRAVNGGDALPEPILHTTGTYALNWDIVTDVAQFEARAKEGLRLHQAGDSRAGTTLEQALDFFTGPYLPDAGEAWAVQRRAVLDALAMEVLNAAAGLCEQQGRLHEALHWRDRLLRLDATHQPSHVAVLRCLLQLGHREQAQLHYDDAVKTLKQEPSAELLSLGARLAARGGPPVTVWSLQAEDCYLTALVGVLKRAPSELAVLYLIDVRSQPVRLVPQGARGTELPASVVLTDNPVGECFLRQRLVRSSYAGQPYGLCVPFKNGVLYIGRGKAYEAEEERRVRRWALQVYHAVRNAAAYQRAVEEQLQDPETGLVNRTYLDRRIQEEYRRCERFGRDMSLVSIQSFSDFKGAVDWLVEQVLDTDLVAHLGNGHFAVLLVEAPSERVEHFVTQVRTQVGLAVKDVVSYDRRPHQ